MKNTTTLSLLLLIIAGNVLADSRTVTFFSDGALVEIESTAVRGATEFPLPGPMLENSLRIKPLSKATIQHVDILPVRLDGRGEQELNRLLEKKNLLEDRLQALATREEIFMAAAKSQSGKAPRRTKTNPDPMESIRHGTEFAIAQLEAVYTARRKTGQELRRLNARITEVRKGSARAETLARVSVSPKNGRIRIRYALAGQGWTPRYDIRLKGDGSADLTLYGQVPGHFNGYRLQAAAGTLSDNAGVLPPPVSAGSLARLAEFRLSTEAVQYGDGIRTAFSSVMSNQSGTYLPAGDASLYHNGEYLGHLRFEGISSGRSKRISTGIRNCPVAP